MSVGRTAARLAPAPATRVELGGPAERSGRVLHDTYRIERLIAEGGMGAVYEAVHLRLQQRFALKVLEHRLARNDEAYERFRQEAEIAAGLNHPNIVQVFDFNHDESGNPYMVMELVEGTTLGDYLGQRRLSVRDALRLIEPLSHALDAAHRAGIVHRDLKPNNIMIRRTSTGALELKLLDFGISKMRDASDGLTSDNVVMGTPNYMSPEQASGRTKAVDARTDIFALGTILYETLAGRRAFDQRTTPELLHAIVYEQPPPLTSVRSDIPPAVADIVHRCMAKSPEQRVQTPKELVSLLRAAVRPQPREPVRDRPFPARRRGRTLAWGAGWIVSLMLAVAAGMSSNPEREPAASSETAASPVPEAEPEVPIEPVVQEPPEYPEILATPGALMLPDASALYRADLRGLTFWADPEAQARVRTLPTMSPPTAIGKTVTGEILVGQADGTVSRWDHELLEPAWHVRLGAKAIVAVAAADDYLAVSTGTRVDLVNGRTGRVLRRFDGEAPVVAMSITRGSQPRLVVIRSGVLEVYDTDGRRRLGRHPIPPQAVSAELERTEADGSAVVWVDFAQGRWTLRRRYRLSSDRRGQKWRLDPLSVDRL